MKPGWQSSEHALTAAPILAAMKWVHGGGLERLETWPQTITAVALLAFLTITVTQYNSGRSAQKLLKGTSPDTLKEPVA